MDENQIRGIIEPVATSVLFLDLKIKALVATLSEDQKEIYLRELNSAIDAALAPCSTLSEDQKQLLRRLPR